MLDGSFEKNARFIVVGGDDGLLHIQGEIDTDLLSKNDKTQLLEQPAESYYMHYERPVNTKLERAATREWLWEG